MMKKHSIGLVGFLGLLVTSLALGQTATYIKGPTLVESFINVYLDASDVALTKDSGTNVVLSGPGPADLILPDATTLPNGRRFRIKNEASVPAEVRFNGGALASTMPLQSTIEALLTSNASSAGTWAIDQALSLYVDAGAVVFGNADSNGIEYDASNLFWNNTSDRLGIGTNTPQQQLHLTQTARIDTMAGGGVVVADVNGDLSAEGPLSVENGGTNSSTSLNSNRVMVSQGGAIVENAALTVGQVMFPGAGSFPSGSSNFFWDNSNSRLGLGASTPSVRLDVYGQARASGLAPGGAVYADSSGLLLSETALAVSRGGTNSSTALNNNRLMVSSGGAIQEHTALTQGQLVYPGASGLPAGSSNLFWDLSNSRLGVGTNAPNERLDVSGGRAFRYNNDATTGNIDALSTLNISSIRFTGAGTVTLRGIANGSDGKEITLTNVTGNDLTINDQDANPTAANRIITGTGANLTVADGASVSAKYDATTQRWRVIGGSGGGGTGGGLIMLNAITWEEDFEASAPFKNQAQYLFRPGETEVIAGWFMVPNDYVTGNPITLKIPVGVGNFIGTLLMRTETRLYQTADVFPFASAPIHTSTNSAISISVPNLHYTVTLDLTTPTGFVDSTQVSPGAVLYVRLFRGTDTNATQAQYYYRSSEVLFQ